MSTNIEWAKNPDGSKGETWPVVTGCSHSGTLGCDMCYAARMAATRLKHHPRYDGLATIKNGKAQWTGKVRFNRDVLEQPLHWKKPRRVFVASMGDLFHEDVPPQFIDSVFKIMEKASRHTFQILTKRALRMQWFIDAYGTYAGWDTWPLPNVHLGVSVENQAAADERIPWLLRTPAAVRFVSYEPALGPVDLSPQHADGTVFAPLGEERFIDCGGCVGTPGSAARAGGLQPTCPGHEAGGIDWVICGGESGPGARPMHPDWARSLRDQCQTAGVPFFFKSWGAWAYDDQLLSDGLAVEQAFPSDNGPFRVGKKAAGNLLDGREHHEFPAADGAGT